MKYLALLITVFLSWNLTIAQDLKAFQIYDNNQQPINFDKMVTELSKYDVVLFGEYHNNSIVHWLQLKTTEALYHLKRKQLILGAEMFERDNQEAVNRYVFGETNEKQLAEEARLWDNFKTDYKPLLDFAKSNQLKFVATNIPRRYASLVAKNGIDTLNNLPKDEKKYIATLPIMVDIATPGYADMIEMMKSHGGGNASDFVAAQAVKDATMAESILKNFKRKHLFLHYNGNYHSKAYGGIYWYLKARKKHMNIAVISIFQSDSIALPLPDQGIMTEFNIVVPEDMTKTF